MPYRCLYRVETTSTESARCSSPRGLLDLVARGRVVVAVVAAPEPLLPVHQGEDEVDSGRVAVLRATQLVGIEPTRVQTAVLAHEVNLVRHCAVPFVELSFTTA